MQHRQLFFKLDISNKKVLLDASRDVADSND